MVDYLKKKLQALAEADGLRVSRALQVDSYFASKVVEKASLSEHALVNFSSNDYLGLAGDLILQEQFFANVDVKTKTNWMSASSARPLTGTSLAHHELELAIATDYGQDKALLFNSGYHANSGILPALTNKDDLILADKLVHASIIDGLRLGSATFKRFAHNDMVHLKRLLERYHQDYQRIWIVTESVFSMDGDVAPIQEILKLKQQYSTLLYVDEAHAVGCYGSKGLGLCESLDVHQQIDIIVGVFGKALAGVGAFAVGSETLIDSLVNFSRSWLFSTALPPLNVEWNLYVWKQLAQFQAQRDQLQHLTQLFHQQLKGIKQHYLGETYIIPVVMSASVMSASDLASLSGKCANRLVVDLSEYLEKKGFLALPIRSPTVKAGTERVRFSLTANMPESSIMDVVAALSLFLRNN